MLRNLYSPEELVPAFSINDIPAASAITPGSTAPAESLTIPVDVCSCLSTARPDKNAAMIKTLKTTGMHSESKLPRYFLSPFLPPGFGLLWLIDSEQYVSAPYV